MSYIHPTTLLHSTAFVLGAIVGSFLNVVIVRLPLGESIVHPRSRCMRCGDRIPGWLNVPILSWILLRGRCRRCQAPISVRYPIVETLTAAIFVACIVTFGPTLAAATAALFASALIAIAFVDMDTWEIPDEISLPGIVIGCALRPFAFGAKWYDGVIAALLGATFLGAVRALYYLFRKKEGMGLGDLKLIAMIGAFVGIHGLIPSILVASIVGSVIGAFLLLLGGSRRATGEHEAASDLRGIEIDPNDAGQGRGGTEEQGDAAPSDDDDAWEPPPNALPFGPFLAIGALSELFFGPAIGELIRSLMAE